MGVLEGVLGLIPDERNARVVHANIQLNYTSRDATSPPPRTGSPAFSGFLLPAARYGFCDSCYDSFRRARSARGRALPASSQPRLV
jgi:hypothetical protein